jgi:hypothetical protein
MTGVSARHLGLYNAWKSGGAIQGEVDRESIGLALLPCHIGISALVPCADRFVGVISDSMTPPYSFRLDTQEKGSQDLRSGSGKNGII